MINDDKAASSIGQLVQSNLPTPRSIRSALPRNLKLDIRQGFGIPLGAREKHVAFVTLPRREKP